MGGGALADRRLTTTGEVIGPKLEEFGFRTPTTVRGRENRVSRGGPGAQRARKWGFVVIAAQLPLVPLSAYECGWFGSSSCGWAVPITIVFVLLQAVWLGTFLLLQFRLPATVEDPRHREVLGQFAAGAPMHPGQAAIFDPEYGRAPPRD